MAAPHNVEAMLYTADRTSRITGVAEHRLARWKRSGLYRPARHPHDFYDFRDLVAIKVIATLQDRGVPQPQLRRFSDWLHERHNRPWSELRFYTAGRSLYFDDPTSRRLVGHHPAGNLAMDEVVQHDLEPVAAAVRNGAGKVSRRMAAGQVVRVRGVQGSERVIAGTRVPIRTIRELHEGGVSKRDILRDYPGLTARDVDAALRHTG